MPAVGERYLIVWRSTIGANESGSKEVGQKEPNPRKRIGTIGASSVPAKLCDYGVRRGTTKVTLNEGRSCDGNSDRCVHGGYLRLFRWSCENTRHK